MLTIMNPDILVKGSPWLAAVMLLWYVSGLSLCGSCSADLHGSQQEIIGWDQLPLEASASIAQPPVVEQKDVIGDRLPRNEAYPAKVSTWVPKPVRKWNPSGNDHAALEYIKKYAPKAIEEYRKYGIPASITLAQGLHESNCGQSTLATKANNHFGIKCWSKRCAKGHCINRTDDTHKDFFKKYQSATQSYDDHSRLLREGLSYQKQLKYNKSTGKFELKGFANWAYGLKKAGYATAKKYPELLMGWQDKYDLTYYDNK